ncbi:MAG: hypothetical protein AB7V06_26140 [Candidatus Obscuribacterales bacterium]
MKATNPRLVLLIASIIAVGMPFIMVIWGVLGGVLVLIAFFAWLLSSEAC